MKKVVNVLKTENGNFLVKTNRISFYLSGDGNKILRVCAPEEWERSHAVWGAGKVFSMEIPERIIDSAINLIESVEEWGESISETCFEQGTEYIFLQPNGDVEKIIWTTGCVWHSYEGAIGNDPFSPNNYTFTKSVNGKQVYPKPAGIPKRVRVRK